jgi:hypothetical protein
MPGPRVFTHVHGFSCMTCNFCNSAHQLSHLTQIAQPVLENPCTARSGDDVALSPQQPCQGTRTTAVVGRNIGWRTRSKKRRTQNTVCRWCLRLSLFLFLPHRLYTGCGSESASAPVRSRSDIPGRTKLCSRRSRSTGSSARGRASPAAPALRHTRTAPRGRWWFERAGAWGAVAVLGEHQCAVGYPHLALYCWYVRLCGRWW